MELGRAYNRLIEAPPPGSEASQFLGRAVADLAGPGGWIIPVRLSLFAEMVKHRPWIPATLRELGGIEGIGVTFLEETFGAASAPPAHRAHRRAALAVLEALLPEPSSDLKGKLQPSKVLQQAAGYTGRDRDFAELLGILDHELRMVTQVDVEGLHGRRSRARPDNARAALSAQPRFPGAALAPVVDPEGARDGSRARPTLPRGENGAVDQQARGQAASELARMAENPRVRRAQVVDGARAAHDARSLAPPSHALGRGVWPVCGRGDLRLLVNRRLHERAVNEEVRELRSSDWQYLPELLDRMAPDVQVWRGQVERIAQDPSASQEERARAALALARHGPDHLDLLQERLLDAGGPERLVLREELARWAGRLAPRSGT